jgi:hypothetical protein
MIGAGLFVWLGPMLYYRYQSTMPLSVALPLSRGGSLREEFTVRGSRKYEVLLRCTEVGEFKEKWTNFLNSNEHPTIPCQISLRVVQDGREVHSTRFTSLEPEGLSGDDVFWSLGPLASLPSGRQEFQLTNAKDLTFLAATQPTVQIRVSLVFTKNRIFNELLSFILGIVILLCGILVLVFNAGKRFVNRSRAA